MKDSMLLTILAGVSVFVLGQFILKLILDPIIDFKKMLGELSELFLREQASITNANTTPETQENLRRFSSMLLANKQAILFYSLSAFLLRLPSTHQLLSSIRSLNIIAYKVASDVSEPSDKHNAAVEIIKEMKNIESNLKITVEYSEL